MDFKVGDQVVRKGQAGPVGLVRKIRKETIRTTLKESKDGAEDPAVTITVLWDNGTTSHFVPEGLAKFS